MTESDLKEFKVGSKWEYMDDPRDIITITSVELGCVKSKNRCFDIPGFRENFREHVECPSEKETPPKYKVGSLIWSPKFKDEVFVITGISQDESVLFTVPAGFRHITTGFDIGVKRFWPKKDDVYVFPTEGSIFKVVWYGGEKHKMIGVEIHNKKVAYSVHDTVFYTSFEFFFMKLLQQQPEKEEEEEEEEKKEERGMVPLGSLLWNKETEKLYVVYASSDRFILISECQKKAVEFVPPDSYIVGPYETKNFMVVLPNIRSTFRMHGHESDCCLYNIRMNPCRIAYTTGNQICEIPIDDFLKKYIPK